MLWPLIRIAQLVFGKPDNMTTLPDGPSNRNYDEIDIAELTNLLLDRKRLILIVSLACTMMVGLYTIATPYKYRSEAMILVSSSIVSPSHNSDGKAQVSEIKVSALEASAYEVLAKGDDLMLALADTLIAMEAISSEIDAPTLASEFVDNLEVDLLQHTGQSDILSTTPLLILKCQSDEKDLPPIVVNIWSELFLKRNQGLSSNVTEDFYEGVVSQYELAKNNLERKENELSKLNSSSNELNLLKTEMDIRNSNLDSSLKTFQRLRSELQQKQKDYEYSVDITQVVEVNGKWLGYLGHNERKLLGNRALNEENTIIKLIHDIEQLSIKDKVNKSITEDLLLSLKMDHEMLDLEFQLSTELNESKQKLDYYNEIINAFQTNIILIDTEIDSLRLQELAIQHTLEEIAPVLITRKAITDDLLWEHSYSEKEFNAETQQTLNKYQLISEEINPIYTKTKQLLANTRFLLTFKEEKKQLIKSQYDSIKTQSKEFYEEVKNHRLSYVRLKEKMVTELEDLQRERYLIAKPIESQLSRQQQLFELYEKNYNELKLTQQSLKIELKELYSLSHYYEKDYNDSREYLSQLSIRVDSLEQGRRQIQREVKVYQETFDRLSKLREEARIARQQAAGDIQVVSKAALSKPVKKQLIQRLLIALVSSFFTVTSFIVIKEMLRNRIRET